MIYCSEKLAGIFLVRGCERFYRGFCRKRCVECGFWVVGLWWFVVSLWLVDGGVSGAEKVTGF